MSGNFAASDVLTDAGVTVTSVPEFGTFDASGSINGVRLENTLTNGNFQADFLSTSHVNSHPYHGLWASGPGSIPAWTLSAGTGGLYEPGPAVMPQVNFIGEGARVAYLEASQYLEQVVGAFDPAKSYSVSLDVIVRADDTAGDLTNATGVVSLFVNGTDVGLNANLVIPSRGNTETFSVVFNGADVPNGATLAGTDLTLRISQLNAGQLSFDNVSFSTLDTASNALSDTGTFSFDDFDGTIADDKVTITPQGNDYVGTFGLQVTQSDTNAVPGQGQWTFNVDNTALQHLAPGDVLTQTYTITIEDDAGMSTSQDVTVTLTAPGEQIATFTDLVADSGLIPNGYHGFQWTASSPDGQTLNTLEVADLDFLLGEVGNTGAVLQNSDAALTNHGGDIIDIRRTDGADFDFFGVSLNGAFGSTAVTIEAFDDGTQVGSQVLNLTTTDITVFSAKWLSVDHIKITPDAGGTVALDNFRYFYDDTVAPVVADGSLELVDVSNLHGGFLYSATGSSWQFGGVSGSGSGLQANGSAFAAPNAVEGDQAAFVQGLGAISQVFTITEAGSYVLTFAMAPRSSYGNGGNTIHVTVVGPDHQGNTTTYDLGQHLPTVSGYTHVSLDLSDLPAGTFTLQFAGQNNPAVFGDTTTFIDDVEINPVSAENVNVATVDPTTVQDLEGAIAGAYTDPIILDLDGDGVEFASTSVAFDIDADGSVDTLGWAGGDDGLLAVDLNGDGQINDGVELFSEVFEGSRHSNSLAALFTFDDNADGLLNASDARFDEVVLWQDADEDGITDAGELRSLAQAGISSIDLDAASSDRTDAGNYIFAEGKYKTADGKTASYVGVEFFRSQADAFINHGTTDTRALSLGAALTITFTELDAFAGEPQSVVIADAPDTGVVAINDDLTITFTPAENHVGEVSFTVEVVDEDQIAHVQTVVLSVEPVDSEIEDAVALATTDLLVDDVDLLRDAEAEQQGDRSFAGDALVAPLDLTMVAQLPAVVSTEADEVFVGFDIAETLVESPDDDIIDSGMKVDVLSQSDEANLFVFDEAGFEACGIERVTDLITDFDAAEGDVFDLSDLFGPEEGASEIVNLGSDYLQVPDEGANEAGEWMSLEQIQPAAEANAVRSLLSEEAPIADVPSTV